MRRVALAVALAACGDDGGTATVDAPMQQQQDAPAANCLIPADYGALGMMTGTAGMMGGVTATITLDAGPPRDTFFLKMVSGKGAFTGGITPGTYTISGADAEYNNCGLCVHIIADIVTGAGPSKFYLAHSGSVTLTSVTAPISGTAQNLMFREVDALGSGQPIPGCTSSITSIEFATN